MLNTRIPVSFSRSSLGRSFRPFAERSTRPTGVTRSPAVIPITKDPLESRVHLKHTRDTLAHLLTLRSTHRRIRIDGQHGGTRVALVGSRVLARYTPCPMGFLATVDILASALGKSSP